MEGQVTCTTCSLGPAHPMRGSSAKTKQHTHTVNSHWSHAGIMPAKTYAAPYLHDRRLGLVQGSQPPVGLRVAAFRQARRLCRTAGISVSAARLDGRWPGLVPITTIETEQDKYQRRACTKPSRMQPATQTTQDAPHAKGHPPRG